MSTLRKTERILKWIILGIALAHLASYFMPIYESIYRGEEVSLNYLYGAGSGYIIVSFTNLLIPIVAIVFLFATFKNSKLFFFGFNATYIINCIFLILNLSKSIKNSGSDYYQYSFKYGYYIFVLTMVFLAIAMIGTFIIYLILRHKESKQVDHQSQQSSQSEIDILKEKIDLLNNLKEQGILTESEYEQKRSDVISTLKV